MRGRLRRYRRGRQPDFFPRLHGPDRPRVVALAANSKGRRSRRQPDRRPPPASDLPPLPVDFSRSPPSTDSRLMAPRSRLRRSQPAGRAGAGAKGLCTRPLKDQARHRPQPPAVLPPCPPAPLPRRPGPRFFSRAPRARRSRGRAGRAVFLGLEGWSPFANFRRGRVQHRRPYSSHVQKKTGHMGLPSNGGGHKQAWRA